MSKSRKIDKSVASLVKLAKENDNRFDELLTEVFNHINLGIIITDQNGLILLCNNLALEILGYNAEEIVGQYSLWDFCKDRETAPLFQECLKNGRSFPPEEVEMSGKSGMDFKVNVKVSPLYGKSNTLQGALAVIHDIHEQRAIEQYQKSMSRMSSIGRILSVIAHEINNPLQSIRTILELSRNPKRTSEQRQHYLEAADAEINRIVNTIGQLRSFYRPQVTAGKYFTDVNMTVLNTLASLESRLTESEVQVEARLAPKLSPVQVVDYQLEQILLNLTSHLLNVTAKNGRLALTTSRVSNGVSITLQNNTTYNSSMANSLEAVFGPGKHSRGGLNLGVSVSHEIVEEMGGRIEFEYNEGLRLTVYLPA
jgi:PAS domain S-box-containing protein